MTLNSLLQIVLVFFYSKLYTSQYCEKSVTTFLDIIEVKPLTLQEMIDSINSLKHNKWAGWNLRILSTFCNIWPHFY